MSYLSKLQGCYRSCFQQLVLHDCNCGDPRFPVMVGYHHCEAADPVASKLWFSYGFVKPTHMTKIKKF